MSPAGGGTTKGTRAPTLLIRDPAVPMSALPSAISFPALKMPKAPSTPACTESLSNFDFLLAFLEPLGPSMAASPSPLLSSVAFIMEGVTRNRESSLSLSLNSRIANTAEKSNTRVGRRTGRTLLRADMPGDMPAQLRSVDIVVLRS